MRFVPEFELISLLNRGPTTPSKNFIKLFFCLTDV
jgi:hypothetical protein